MLKNINRRNDQVENILNIKDVEVREALSNIIESAYKAGDAEAVYFAGRAQQQLRMSRPAEPNRSAVPWRKSTR